MFVMGWGVIALAPRQQNLLFLGPPIQSAGARKSLNTDFAARYSKRDLPNLGVDSQVLPNLGV